MTGAATKSIFRLSNEALRLFPSLGASRRKPSVCPIRLSAAAMVYTSVQVAMPGSAGVGLLADVEASQVPPAVRPTCEMKANGALPKFPMSKVTV